MRAVFKTCFVFMMTYCMTNATEMPPVPPGFMPNNDKEKGMPESCKPIPPMLIHFPPPMLESLYQCHNDFFMPKKEMLEEKLKVLLKSDVTISSILTLEGFKRVYEVKLEDNSTLYCNEEGSKCIKGEILD